MANTNQSSLSLFVDRAIPEFIRRDHPRFHKFVETFFEFAERQYDLTLPVDQQFDPSPYWLVQNILKNNDIDEAYELYLKHINGELGHNWPMASENIFVTEYDQARHRQILKIMVDFYRTKGTPDSFSYFFRAIFDKYFDFYLPKQDMLRVSDGKWDEPYLIRLDKISGPFIDEYAEYTSLTNAKVVGAISGAVGTIQQVYTENVFAKKYTPFDNEYGKVFDINDQIYSTTVYKVGLTTTLFNLLQDVTGLVDSDIQVKVNGFLVQPADYVVSIIGSAGSVTLNAPAVDNDYVVISSLKSTQHNWIRISNLDGFFKEGELLHIFPEQEDNSYSSTFIADFSIKQQSYDVEADTIYLIEPDDVGINRPPGEWLNEDGWISSRKKIQDSYYYQDYSYEVRTDLSLVDFGEDLDNLLHPAGFLRFNRFTEEMAQVIDFPGTLDLEAQCMLVHIEDDATFTTDFSIEDEKWLIENAQVRYGGLDWDTLDRYKTRHYNTYLSSIYHEERTSGSLNPLKPLDFRINSANNHNLVWVDDVFIPTRYIDEDTNYFNFHGQFLDFFKPTTGLAYIYTFDGKRTTYNEYGTMIGNYNAGVDYLYTLSQFVGPTVDEQDFLVFVDGVKLLANGVPYNANDTEIVIADVASYGTNADVTICVFKKDELKHHIESGAIVGSTLITLPGSHLPTRNKEYLIFNNGTVVAENKYEIDGNDIIFYQSFNDTEFIEIYAF
ncbi:MAG: hypothetical protein QM489_01110 [Candidatus Izemoplasma sp.]